MSFCSLTKAITPKLCRLCVCVMINKHSFEPFMCLVIVTVVLLCCCCCFVLFFKQQYDYDGPSPKHLEVISELHPSSTDFFPGALTFRRPSPPPPPLPSLPPPSFLCQMIRIDLTAHYNPRSSNNKWRG